MLSDGRKYGQLLSTCLTSDGVDYVLEAVAEAESQSRPQIHEGHANKTPWASLALECWKVEFDYIDFPSTEDSEEEE